MSADTMSQSNETNVYALVMAAGTGERFAGGVPKQLVLLYDRPLVAWSVGRLAACSAVAGIVVAAPPDGVDAVRTALAASGDGKVRAVVAGGDTRQESVAHGLDALPEDASHVLIHDAARPCLGADLVERLLAALREHDAVVPVVPAVDTLVHERDGRVDAILDRVHIAGVQTPQAFAVDVIRTAHRGAHARGLRFSDDGSLVFALGESGTPVATVPGERTNIKVTYAEDLLVAEAILRAATNPDRELS